MPTTDYLRFWVLPIGAICLLLWALNLLFHPRGTPIRRDNSRLIVAAFGVIVGLPPIVVGGILLLPLAESVFSSLLSGLIILGLALLLLLGPWRYWLKLFKESRATSKGRTLRNGKRRKKAA